VKHASEICCAVAVIALPLSAMATTINFDNFAFNSGTSLIAASSYQSVGAVFNRSIPLENVGVAEPGNLTAFINAGGTTPNALALNNALGSQIDLTFVLPGTSTPATTNGVSILFFDTEVGSTLGTIQAFDANNGLLATQTMITPASKGATLHVSAPAIAWVRFSVDNDGAALDNLVFPTPVPEPAAAALFVFGLGALGILAIRRFGRRLRQVQTARGRRD